MQRIREHKVVAVVQGIVRGVQTRTWFRTSLSAAAEKITNRDFFKRLANIGALQRSLSTTKSGTSNLNVDRLAQQACARAPCGGCYLDYSNSAWRAQPLHAFARSFTLALMTELYMSENADCRCGTRKRRKRWSSSGATAARATWRWTPRSSRWWASASIASARRRRSLARRTRR